MRLFVLVLYYFVWDVSSVGSERMLDRHEVTGSIPVRPTIIKKGSSPPAGG